MEHCVHLSAGAVIKEISPTSNGPLMKKIEQAVQQAEFNGNSVDFKALEVEISSVLGSDDNGDSENNDFTVGDTIGKALALVKQVSHTIHVSFSKLTVKFIRFVCHLKQEHTSDSVVGIVIRMNVNLSYGFALDGLLFIRLSIV